MGILWVSYGYPMGILWVSYGYPMAKHPPNRGISADEWGATPLHRAVHRGQLVQLSARFRSHGLPPCILFFLVIFHPKTIQLLGYGVAPF